MEYIKESNKNLMSLRTSLITTVVVLTGVLLDYFYLNLKSFQKQFSL